MRTRGFSMLELVIVIVIIGIIAAIAIPRFSRAAQSSSFNATQACWVNFEKQMLLYESTYGDYPPSMNAGQFNNCVKDFIRPEDWLTPPPLGGAWIWYNSGGVMGIGIQLSPAPTALWQNYDNAFDDGNLTSGLLQANASTFMRILSGSAAVSVEPAGDLGVSAVEPLP